MKISKYLNGKNDIIINDEVKLTANEIEFNLEPNFKVPIKIDCYSLIDDKYINIKYSNGNIESVNLSSEYFKDLEKLEDDRAILICTNTKEFLERLQKNTNSNIKFGKVKYYKQNNHPFYKDINKMSFKQKNEAAIKSLFLKNEKYEKQKEYRIVAINLEEDFIKNV